MAVTRLNHVSITVADIDRSLGFWHDLLDLPLHGRGFSEAGHLEAIVGIGPARIEWAELDLPGGQMLELFRYLEPSGGQVRPAPNDAGATHVCLEVDDIEGLVERLKAAGRSAALGGPCSHRRRRLGGLARRLRVGPRWRHGRAERAATAAAMSVEVFEAALFDLFATLDAEDWDGLVGLLEEDAELADELTGSWLHGRTAIAAYLRAQAGIVTEINSPAQSVHVRPLGPGHALVTFEMRQRYLLNGEIRKESLTGCVVFKLHPDGPRVALYHLGGAGSVSTGPIRVPEPVEHVGPPLRDELRRRRTRAGLSLRALARRRPGSRRAS